MKSVSIAQFKTTYNLFKDYTGYSEPLSYSEWLSLPDEHKVAVLYCQFFDQITLAWVKNWTIYSEEENGVAEVIQYLDKQVNGTKRSPGTKLNEKSFTPAYIYRVISNCLYCMCKDDNRYKKAYTNEMSSIVSNQDGEELDMFDTLIGEDVDYTDPLTDSGKSEFWAIIEDMGKSAEVVVAELLGDEMGLSGKKFTKRDHDKVSNEERQMIIEQLRSKLVKFAF